MKWAYRVPGRVELAGKHVDYAGGCSLTCATSVHLTAQVEALERAALQVSDARTQRQAKIALSPTAGPSKERWSVYLAAVARRIARDFPTARTGASMRIDSTIPTSAGLSSSSALVISAALALFDVNGLWESPVWRDVGSNPLAFAEYCAAMESGAPWGPFAGDTGVGTRGGAQDHIAICASQDGMVGVYGYLPGRIVRREAWPGAWRIVVANSGVKATKTGNARLAYNRAADSVRSLVAVWNAETGRADETLSAALESSPDAYRRLLSLSARAASDTLSEAYLRARLEGFQLESTGTVPQLADAIAAADAQAAGELMMQSQRIAEEALENQVPQTRWLAKRAVELGATGATAFGAGFGGAVWALVASGDAEAFAAEWGASYLKAYRVAALRGGTPLVMVPSAGIQREVIS